MSIARLELDAAARVAVVGRSGSGKTTFLKLLAGLVQFGGGPLTFCDSRSSRTVNFVGRVEARKLRSIGLQTAYVPQQLGLWSHMTILDNVTLPARRLTGLGQQDSESRCREILSQLGLIHKINDRPSQLSGGEQQRIAIARAVLCRPNLILLDEITSALDPSTTGEILGLLPRLFADDATLIFVTHEYGFAKQFATHVLFFDQGEYIANVTTGQIDQAVADKRLMRLVEDSKRFYSW